MTLSKTDKIKQILEVFGKSERLVNLNLDNFHENIIDNAVMGKAFIWNKKETKFIYNISSNFHILCSIVFSRAKEKGR